jgi:hypothetical protein
MKKIKLPNFGTVLLGLAALVNMARWVGVFTVSQNGPAWTSQLLPFLDAISGLFTGLTVAGGLAFVTHRLGGLQPFTPKGRPIMRFWGAAVSAASILIMSAFLLPPYVRMTMPDELKAQIGNLDVWSVMAVLVGDLIIVAIALADSKAAGFTRSSDEQSTSKPLSESSGAAHGRSAKKSGRSKPLSKSQAVVPCRYAGTGCERTGSQAAMNAHARACPFKPTISMPAEEKVKAEK